MKLLLALSVLFNLIISILLLVLNLSITQVEENFTERLSFVESNAIFHSRQIGDKLEERIGSVEHSLDSINFILGVKTNED